MTILRSYLRGSLFHILIIFLSVICNIISSLIAADTTCTTNQLPPRPPPLPPPLFLLLMSASCHFCCLHPSTPAFSIYASYLLQEYQGMRRSYQTAMLEYLVMLRQECLVFWQGGLWCLSGGSTWWCCGRGDYLVPLRIPTMIFQANMCVQSFLNLHSWAFISMCRTCLLTKFLRDWQFSDVLQHLVQC